MGGGALEMMSDCGREIRVGGVWEWLYLRVIATDTRASSPGTVTDVGLAVSKAADEFL